VTNSAAHCPHTTGVGPKGGFGGTCGTRFTRGRNGLGPEGKEKFHRGGPRPLPRLLLGGGGEHGYRSKNPKSARFSRSGRCSARFGRSVSGASVILLGKKSFDFLGSSREVSCHKVVPEPRGGCGDRDISLKRESHASLFQS